jgi:hypothetical protein
MPQLPPAESHELRRPQAANCRTDRSGHALMVKLRVPERPRVPGHAGQRWRGGRAVEGSCLENSRTMSSVGSNPTLSATKIAEIMRKAEIRCGLGSARLRFTTPVTTPVRMRYPASGPANTASTSATTSATNCFAGCEVPVDPRRRLVPRGDPCRHFLLHRGPVPEATVEALPLEHAQFDLDHVQLTAMPGRVVDLQPVGQAFGPGGGEGVLQ